MKKYEITDIAHPDNPNLHRIRAVTDLTEDALKGMLGGYVESYDIDRLLKNTRQIKRLLGTCQPLMYFDKQVFTSLVSKVTISDTSFEFELINGMRVSERRTSR